MYELKFDSHFELVDTHTMRLVSFLLTFCLIFSNVASAAMFCCADIDEPQIEQEAKMPCHDAADASESQVPDADHECECQGCAQFAHLAEPTLAAHLSGFSVKLFDLRGFVSSDPRVIYHPPKHIS